MAPRRFQRRVGLDVRMLLAMALLGLVYAGIGWGMHLLGVPVWTIVVLAGAVLAGQWLGTERLALAATGAREVAPEQVPTLHQALVRLCALTGQPVPRLALSPDQAPNAFTVGRSRRRAVIVVTWGLRCRLEPRELEAVLAHELAHIEHRDVAVMTMASSWALALAWVARMLGTGAVAGAHALRYDPLSEVGLLGTAVAAVGAATTAVVGAVAYLPLRALSRYRELAADRTAAIHLGQPALLASVLVKVHGDGSGIPDADLRRRTVPAIGLVARPGPLAEWFPTHPSLACRLSQLDALLAELR
jgi:heat shock protein HtpX